jgi:uncharacterized RDD family membrane protein YckC
VSSSPTPQLHPGSTLDNRRVGAALIDIAIMLPFLVVLYVLAGDSAAYPALAAAWALFYYFACESGTGQTPGKHLLGLRVVRADGRPADMGAIAVRTALRPVDALFGYLLGLIVMLRTGERRQRIGDLAAHTVVTDARVAMAATGPPAATSDAEETYGDGFGAPETYGEPEPETHTDPESEPHQAPIEALEPRAESEPEPGGAPLEAIEPRAHLETAHLEVGPHEPPVEPDYLGAPLDEDATPVEYAWMTPTDDEAETVDAVQEPEPEVADEPEPEVADEPEPEVADEPEPEVADEPEPEVADEPEADGQPEPESDSEPEDVPPPEPQSAADLLFGDDAEQDEPRDS